MSIVNTANNLFGLNVEWAVELKGGNIISVVEEKDWQGSVRSGQIIDYGEAVVMPGLIDV